MVAVLIVAIILIISAVYVSYASRKGVAIASWHWELLLFSGIVGNFTVNLTNEADVNITVTLVCSVTFDNSDKYIGSKEVTLSPGEERSVFVHVVLHSSHFGDVGYGNCRIG